VIRWSAPAAFTSRRYPGKLRLKCDGTRAATRFLLSAKRTSPFKSAQGRQFNRLLAAELCASAVVMLDTSCSEVVWRVLATHSIRQYPLHFPSRASPCAMTFQLESTHFCWRISRSQGHSAGGRIMSMNNSNGTILKRIRDLPACSTLTTKSRIFKFVV